MFAASTDFINAQINIFNLGKLEEIEMILETMAWVNS